MGKEYIHLTLDERHEIYRLQADDRSRRSIAKAISRDVSCTRENLGVTAGKAIIYLILRIRLAKKDVSKQILK